MCQMIYEPTHTYTYAIFTLSAAVVKLKHQIQRRRYTILLQFTGTAWCAGKKLPRGCVSRNNN